MDRRQEYEALLRELEETPPALEYTVQRAVARRRRRRWGRRLGIPAASLAGVFTAFVVLVNTSMPFAMACSGVPGLRELMAAVALSPSLKAAVEHDYAQYIGQSQTDNGITLRLEYLILDQGQISFFMEAEGPYTCYHLEPRLYDAAGEEWKGCTISNPVLDGGTLTQAVTVHVVEESFQIPEEIRMKCRVNAHTEGGEERRGTALVSFTVPVDTQSLNDCRSLPVGDWVEVDGQRLRFGLDSYPTHGRLTVEEHPDNTARLAGMDFYLEDETGRRYEDNPAGSVGAIGSRRMCDTTYFSDPAHLALYITRLEWLDQGRERVTVDLETGAVGGMLPEGVEIYTHRISDRIIEIAALAEQEEKSGYGLLGTGYRTEAGEERSIRQYGYRWDQSLWSGTSDETVIPDGWFAQLLTLEDYPWSTVELDLQFTQRHTLEEPMEVTLW